MRLLDEMPGFRRHGLPDCDSWSIQPLDEVGKPFSRELNDSGEEQTD